MFLSCKKTRSWTEHVSLRMKDRGVEDSFFFSSRRRHTRCLSDWSSDVCSSDLICGGHIGGWELGSADGCYVLATPGKVDRQGLLLGGRKARFSIAVGRAAVA